MALARARDHGGAVGQPAGAGDAGEAGAGPAGQADYWLRHRKGFALDVVPHEMKRHAPFP